MLVCVFLIGSLAQAASSFTNPPIVLTVEGTNVWIRPHQTNTWITAFPRQELQEKDRGRTGADSRTSIRLSDLSVLRIGVFSEFEIQPLPEPEIEAEFSLWRGLMRLLNRDRPGIHRFKTPTATAATRGTEFVLEVDEDTGRTRLTVFEGEAEMTNEFGAALIGPGEQGEAIAGRAPTVTAVIDTTAIVQWSLYYPGVLHLEDVELTAEERAELAASLAAYGVGDLLGALAAYPEGRVPTSGDESVYLAALWLSAGRVATAEQLLDDLAESIDGQSRAGRMSAALRRMVALVNQRPLPVASPDASRSFSATEWLVESYELQSRFFLTEALTAARESVRVAPDFAFGWVRVAELEFSHGRVPEALEALEALDRSFALALRNAQAVALRGFLLAAQNRITAAIEEFERAIELDGGLGNAWLGRGLCRIRQGDADAGRFDLQVAAALEPQRSILRSYLGKAFANAGDTRLARRELHLAQAMDPKDPTPWLYSALLLRDENRANEAVRDLEHSQELNENRRVYRSRLLLDQDRAVRGANLARVYQEAGLDDVSLREAARAVNSDYANYSAHLFLANSYNALRDPDQINLRFETAWFSEYLLANLLAPVGAGTLSQAVSQQEYSKLFERNRFGFSASADYFSHGEWFQRATQHGLLGNSSYAAEFFRHTDDGQRPNNDLEQLALVLNLKHQLTPQDGLYFRASYYDTESGDVFPYFDPANANPTVRLGERHEPWLLAGYHHEWQPGHHLVALGGWLNARFQVTNGLHTTPVFDRGTGGPVQAAVPMLSVQDYRGDLDLHSLELQDIWQRGDHTLVIGGTAQTSDFNTRNQQDAFAFFNGTPVTFNLTQHIRSDFLRLGAYVYDHWQVHPDILLVGGISYHHVTHPRNHRFAPLVEGEDSRGQVSPKGGVIWTPTSRTTVRAAYAQGIGGASLDQSVRLEPSQVAGFNQAFRSLIPESIAGANSAPTFETAALSLEQKLGERLFLGLAGEAHWSEVDRTIGVVNFVIPTTLGSGFSAGSTREELNFREQSLIATAQQLLGDHWGLGVRYRLSRAELDQLYPELPATVTTLGGFQRQQDVEAILHQLHLGATYNHPSGFFGRAGAVWTAQSNTGYSPDLPGDDFWQF
ncbi:MAG TPA: hypothetical protein DCY13_07750, partial [Verrucomicrobiales bacterium]|nr:hypothetical protein [Verrucomicrobiales bacterium]